MLLVRVRVKGLGAWSYTNLSTLHNNKKHSFSVFQKVTSSSDLKFLRFLKPILYNPWNQFYFFYYHTLEKASYKYIHCAVKYFIKSLSEQDTPGPGGFFSLYCVHYSAGLGLIHQMSNVSKHPLPGPVPGGVISQGYSYLEDWVLALLVAVWVSILWDTAFAQRCSQSFNRNSNL